MRTTLKRVLLGLVSAATVAALAVPGSAFAKGPGGGGGGGGRPGEDPAARFSLSVPALFVGEDPYGLTCSTDGNPVAPTAPTGTPLTGYWVDPGAYFFVQGVHTWQAECFEGLASATADAYWGDNLSGDAKLKVGKPIRVEIGLNAGAQGMTGWNVIKLEDTLDRLSAYGTQATPDGDEWVSQPNADFPETRVWTAGTHLRVYPAGHPELAVVDEAASAEINATGRVVYGYNLRVSDIGVYTLEYTFPDVTVTSVNHGGGFEVVGDATVVTKDIQVISGGGGGGGGPKH